MDPVTGAAISAAIQIIADIIKQLSEGKITDAQAQAYLTASATHYRASVAGWDAAPGPGA